MSKNGIGIDGVTEPTYFLITAIGFVIVGFINYKKIVYSVIKKGK